VPKKAQITQERVEYNVFLFDESLKGSKSLKIFKISLTFRFDKLSNLSKSVHTGEKSQILTVSNKKSAYLNKQLADFHNLKKMSIKGMTKTTTHKHFTIFRYVNDQVQMIYLTLMNTRRNYTLLP
jgi:hypothetical protein